MVKNYVDHTNDKAFAISVVDTMAVELNFWLTNHTTIVNGHTLATYGHLSAGPRPESYSEDIATASFFATDALKADLFNELKAGAESGLDFSSREVVNPTNYSNIGNLTNSKIRSIIPVELNAYLYNNAKIVAEFYGYKNDAVNQAKYAKISADLLAVSLLFC